MNNLGTRKGEMQIFKTKFEELSYQIYQLKWDSRKFRANELILMDEEINLCKNLNENISFEKIFNSGKIDVKLWDLIKKKLLKGEKEKNTISDNFSTFSNEISKFEKNVEIYKKKMNSLVKEMQSWLNKTNIYPNYNLNDAETILECKNNLNIFEADLRIIKNNHSSFSKEIAILEKYPIKEQIKVIEGVIKLFNDYNVEGISFEFEKRTEINPINNLQEWRLWLEKELKKGELRKVKNIKFTREQQNNFTRLGQNSILKELESKLMILKVRGNTIQNLHDRIKDYDLSLLNTDIDVIKIIINNFKIDKEMENLEKNISKIESEIKEINLTIDSIFSKLKVKFLIKQKSILSAKNLICLSFLVIIFQTRNI